MLKRYSEYKDSGIEWVGQVPEPWVSKRLKHLVRLVNEKGVSEEDSLPINLENIESWTGRLISGEAVDQEPSEEEMKRFKSGDVLFNKLRPYLAKVYRADSDGACGGELLVLRPQKENMRSGFLFYRLLSKGFISVVDGSTYGTKMPRASWDFIGNLMIASPKMQEQEIISDFLDNKTMQIDDLIAKKERMIELLKEERTAIINQAVTKGIDPKVEMKDFGIEWLGKVPKHWEIKRLKYVTNINPQRPDGISDEAKVVFIAMESMNADGTYDNSIVRSYAEVKSGFTYFAEGDVIFAKITPCFENGKGALLHNLGTPIGFGSTEFHVLRAVKSKTISEYLYFLTISGLFRGLGEAFMQGVAGQKRVTNDFVQDFIIGIPPVDEQETISVYLEEKIKRIDTQIGRENKSIEYLKEYRTSLISEVVTGKIDVRR